MRGLPTKIRRAVAEFLEILAQNPHRLSKPLRAPLDDLRSARRGAYCIALELDEHQHVIHIVRVDHRADAYRH